LLKWKLWWVKQMMVPLESLQVLFAFLWECSSILDSKTSQCQMFIPTWWVITFSNHFLLVPCTLVERVSLEICANYDMEREHVVTKLRKKKRKNEWKTNNVKLTHVLTFWLLSKLLQGKDVKLKRIDAKCALRLNVSF
jgi:hypothetical protein